MQRRIKEYCGLFGICGHRQASYITYLGLYALQHRGEESAGIVSSDDGKGMRCHKGMGQVADVFTEESLKKLTGNRAIGHVRYSTTGSSLMKNAQPLLMEYQKGVTAIAHNGNLVNSRQLKRYLENRGSIFQTTTDSEIIIHLMAHSRRNSFKRRLLYALKRLKGAYSLLLMDNEQIVGVRDPYGFRPLCLGKLNNAFCLASETCAFDLIGARFIREVEPGEIVFLSKSGLRSLHPPELKAKVQAMCIFEHIYFARPDSIIFGETVHSVRKRLGEQLAIEHPADADIVIPVPDSGTSAALGFSNMSEIPLEWGIIRNHYVGRTFIQPRQEIRDLGVKIKFNVLREVIKGKRIVVVDDSIVRGTTSRKRIRNLRRAGAKEVHLRISCPPHMYPCFYGIDFPKASDLLARRMSLKRIKEFLGVDSIGYLSLEGLLNSVKFPKENYCVACFTGRYPVKFRNADKYMLEGG